MLQLLEVLYWADIAPTFEEVQTMAKDVDTLLSTEVWVTITFTKLYN
jgi:hypothetical protein